MMKPTDNVVTLYTHNYRDIPATLRRIADEIEHGDMTNVSEAALVTKAPYDISIYGLGPTSDIRSTHFLLTAGTAEALRLGLHE